MYPHQLQLSPGMFCRHLLVPFQQPFDNFRVAVEEQSHEKCYFRAAKVAQR